MLEAIGESSVLIRTDGPLSYEVLAPSYVLARLGGGIGRPVTLHTLYYLESQNQGSSFLPRLAGVLTVQDRRFFELFTTCKGIGNRKALRAMALDTGQIAAAIAGRDATILQSLPEIGRRTAETIIATLHDKVDAFVGSTAFTRGGAAEGSGAAAPSGMGRDALGLLVQLGENRVQAMQWIDQVLRGDDKPGDVQELIARVYQIKAGG